MKYLIIGAVAGLIVTIILSLLTARVDGFNVMSGETTSLTGWKAIVFDIGEKGPQAFLLSLLPTYLLLMSSVSISCYLLANYWNKSA